MPRKVRNIQGGTVYHVINRAAGRAAMFRKEADYAAFEKVLGEAVARVPLRILTYVLMPNHFHLVVWPKRGQERALSEFMRWLQVTHTQRWHAHYHTSGTGPLYQGRFKAFPVQGDFHVRTVCKYVDRNAVRAKLCGRAAAWRWGGLWRRVAGTEEQRKLLSAWPEGTEVVLERWLAQVNAAEKVTELAAMRESVRRGRPFGEKQWVESTAKALDLGHTMRPRGRPRKEEAGKGEGG